MRFQVPAGSIVLVFSPMLSQVAGGGHHDARVPGPRRGGRGLPARRRRGGRATTSGSRWPGGCGCWSARRCWAGCAAPASRWSPGAGRARSTRCCAGSAAAARGRRRAGGERPRAGLDLVAPRAQQGCCGPWPWPPVRVPGRWSRSRRRVPPGVHRGPGVLLAVAGRAAPRVARRRSGWCSTSAGCGCSRTPAPRPVDAARGGRPVAVHLACTLSSYGPPGLRLDRALLAAAGRGRTVLCLGAAVLVWLAAGRGLPRPAARVAVGAACWCCSAGSAS